MKPEDIQVGKRYRNCYNPGQIWLGIGLRKLYTEDECVSKALVCIEGKSDQIGWIAQSPEDSFDGFRDAWELESESSGIFILYAHVRDKSP